MMLTGAGPLPRSCQYEGFLSEEERLGLLEWSLSNEGRFKPAKLTGGILDPTRRVATKLGDLGPHKAVLERRLSDRLPDIFRGIGIKPFSPDFLEIELAAHGDGAFFATHTDLPIGPNRRVAGGDGSGRHSRLVSAVYYFHREPKRFSGGSLCLYRHGDPRGDLGFVEIHPTQNSLAAFSSWTRHEVKRVACPSGEFADYRFAVNIWLCREDT
ncbi:MAG TPA: 2OG-Fe(II) oxygenase [Allosphingosinicella sp.]|jgi:hypothetical protein